MPAYNFEKRFAEAVVSGIKSSTIRLSHKNAKPGGTAYLFTGQRTVSCRRLGDSPIISVEPIVITQTLDGGSLVLVNCIALTPGDKALLARTEGFADLADMLSWFREHYGDQFSGWLHKWVPLKP